jgi:hypothetical protein
MVLLAGVCFLGIFLFVRQSKGFYFNKHNKELGDLVLLKSNPTVALILAMTLFFQLLEYLLLLVF